jgi:molybdopterin converting factor small subunit
MKAIKSIYYIITCALVLSFFIVSDNTVFASSAAANYIQQIASDVNAAVSRGDGDASDIYSRIEFNIGQLNSELNIRYQEALSLIGSGQDAKFPSVNLNNPIEGEFKRMESLRTEIMDELRAIYGKYSDFALRQYSQDMTFISNMVKQTISYGTDVVPKPIPVDVTMAPFDIKGKVDDAKVLKQNVQVIMKTRQEAEQLHEEFERVKSDALPAVEYHYQQLGAVNGRLISVIEAHKEREKGFDAEVAKIKEKLKKEKEEEKRRAEEQESVLSRINSEVQSKSTVSVNTYSVKPPDPDDEDALAKLRALLNNAISLFNNAVQTAMSLSADTVVKVEKHSGTAFRYYASYDLYANQDVTKVHITSLSKAALSYLEDDIERHNKTIGIFEAAENDFNGFLSSFINQASSPLSDIISISRALGSPQTGDKYKGDFETVCQNIAKNASTLKQQVIKLKEEIKDIEGYISRLHPELSKRVNEANTFINSYQSAYNRVYNAKVAYEHAIVNAAKVLCEMFEIDAEPSDIWTYEGQYAIRMVVERYIPIVPVGSTLHYHVKTMIREGALQDVKPYLERYKRDAARMVERVQQVRSTYYDYLVAVADLNNVSKIYPDGSEYSGVLYHPDYGSLVIDVWAWSYEKEKDFDFGFGMATANSFFDSNINRIQTMVFNIDDFLEYLNIILNMDDSLAGSYKAGGWEYGRETYWDMIRELNEFDNVLDLWLDHTVQGEYDENGNLIENLKIYNIPLPNMEEARSQAYEIYSREQMYENVRKSKDEAKELLNKLGTLTGFMEFGSDKDVEKTVKDMKSLADYVLHLDDVRADVQKTAAELLELAYDIDYMLASGPINDVQSFYDKFAGAYEKRSIRDVLGFIDKDWRASDGERRRDLEDRLTKLFRSWDEFEVDINVERVSVGSSLNDEFRVVYTIRIEGISYNHDFTYSEHGQVTEILSFKGGKDFIIVRTER